MDDPNIYGLWRDGHNLVIELRHHRFPDRCIKSNAAVGDHRSLVELNIKGILPEELDEIHDELVESSGMTVRSWEFGWGNRNNVTIPFKVPLSPGNHAKASSRIGTWFVIGGIIVAVLGLPAILFLTAIDLRLFNVGIAIFFVGVAATIAGFAINYLREAGILQLVRVADGKAWIAGPHITWLAVLPEFTATETILRRSHRRARLNMWTALGLSLVCLVVGVLAGFVGVGAWLAKSEDVTPVVGILGLVLSAGGFMLLGAAWHERAKLIKLDSKPATYISPPKVQS